VIKWRKEKGPLRNKSGVDPRKKKGVFGNRNKRGIRRVSWGKGQLQL